MYKKLSFRERGLRKSNTMRDEVECVFVELMKNKVWRGGVNGPDSGHFEVK